MLLRLFPKDSWTTWQTVKERQEAVTRAEFFEEQVKRIASAFIKESIHPDCLPGHRFRVTMPDGTMKYRGTRLEAEDLFYETTSQL